MHITLTNLGTVTVPLASSNGNGLAIALDPETPVTVDAEEIVVASVGDNPSLREEIEDAFRTVLETVVRLVTFWREQQASEPPHHVRVLIANHGDNGLRVLLGSNVNEVQVSAGATYTAEAPEYVEIRELGV